jgi:hypothetical protein
MPFTVLAAESLCTWKVCLAGGIFFPLSPTDYSVMFPIGEVIDVGKPGSEKETML